MDSGFIAIGPRFALTRWQRPGMTAFFIARFPRCRTLHLLSATNKRFAAGGIS
jgi:hypothetical protein